MCYSETKRTICELCNTVVSTEKDLKHKCFDVLKADARFGACGRRYGLYETLVRVGACTACWRAALRKKRRGR